MDAYRLRSSGDLRETRSQAMSLETLFTEAGGMGRMQWIVLCVVYTGKLFCGWSVFQMNFAGIIPDFYCERHKLENDLELDPLLLNATINTCSIPGNATDPGSGTVACGAYNFTGSFRTIITDFNLVCDKNWVKATVTSIQMAGLLVGSVVAGQMGDSCGRWRTNFLFAFIMAASNIATSFANSWEIFAVCRFVIGVGIGGSAVACFMLSVEFMTSKWRPLSGCFPAWAVGICCFALSAYLLQDWRDIQLACGVCGLLVLPLLFIVPESPRWLTVQGRLDEAGATIDKVARWNGRSPVPYVEETLQKVYEEEKKARESGQKYTYLDAFRNKSTAKITIIMSYHWFCYAFVYYGIAFGISSLAGNFFVNILLLGIIDIPPQLATFFFNKVLGRKWTAALAVAFSLTCLDICMILQTSGHGGEGSEAITVLSLAAKATASMAWMSVMTWGSELYPTVIRNLGCGICNTSSRVAGIVAPFVINFDERMMISYSTIVAVLALDLVLVFLLQDTTDRELHDSFTKVISSVNDDDEDDDDEALIA